jgi:hypothetical protein
MFESFLTFVVSVVARDAMDFIFTTSRDLKENRTVSGRTEAFATAVAILRTHQFTDNFGLV